MAAVSYGSCRYSNEKLPYTTWQFFACAFHSPVRDKINALTAGKTTATKPPTHSTGRGLSVSIKYKPNSRFKLLAALRAYQSLTHKSMSENKSLCQAFFRKRALRAHHCRTHKSMSENKSFLPSFFSKKRPLKRPLKRLFLIITKDQEKNSCTQ